MPLDDLSFDLTGAVAPPSPPVVEVMARALRLPTRSIRQARSIVRMQIDRLSPLPASETVFDLAPLRVEAGETVYALGILRRSVLADPAFGAQRIVVATAVVEGREIAFRFRNNGAIGDRESRWLKHAPKAALVCLGLAAVALAGNIRAERWRDQRLPAIAAEQRLTAQQALAADLRTSARDEWLALERTDASTRFLCVAGRVAAVRPEGVAIRSASADPQRVTLMLAPGPAAVALSEALNLPTADAASADAPILVFPSEMCG